MFADGLDAIAGVMACHKQSAFRALQRGKVPGAKQLANGRWRLDVDAYRAAMTERSRAASAPKPKTQRQLNAEAAAARQAAREAARAEREIAIEEPDSADPFRRVDDAPTPAEITRNSEFLRLLHLESLATIRSERTTEHE